MQTSRSWKDRALWRLRRILLAQSGRGRNRPARNSPIVVAGLFSTASGIGETARAMSAAIRAQGLDVTEIDLSGTFGQADLPTRNCRTDLKELAPGMLILCLNAPETAAALFALGLRRWQGWHVVGYWAWELSVAPPSWSKAAHYLAEVWTPSRFVTDIFAPVLPIPVSTVPHFVPVPDQAPDAPAGAGLRCLAMADGRSSLDRKNLKGAIELFQLAFKGEKSARLVLKLRNLGEDDRLGREIKDAVVKDARISLIDQTLTASEVKALIADCHILLSPHRSEGFGLHLAQAMALGKAVLATAWSGNMEFMSEDNSGLIPYRLVPVNDISGVYEPIEGAQWADPDIEEGARTLRHWAGAPQLLSKIGKRARADIAHSLDGSAQAQHLA